MTRAQIEDLEAFAEEVSTLAHNGYKITEAIAKAAIPHVLAPHGCHRDGDSLSIRDTDGGDAIYFTKNDQEELWVSATHRNGARINPEQFLWLTKELSPWLDGRDVS